MKPVTPERRQRRRGRPRLTAEPLTAVTAFIPVSDYNRLTQLAQQRDDKSLSGLIRDRVTQLWRR